MKKAALATVVQARRERLGVRGLRPRWALPPPHLGHAYLFVNWFDGEIEGLASKMAIADQQEITALAFQCLTTATRAAQEINLLESERSLYKKAAAAQMISDLPRYAEIPPFYGVRSTAAILFVDIRGSSDRAITIGPRKTYITMHTFMPVMAELVGKANGVTVGLRGDGLFGAFGLEDFIEGAGNNKADNIANAVQAASACGEAMIETVERVLNPLFDRYEVSADAGALEIGVGIDAGEIVVTRIGRHSAQELTAYGAAVNEAAHLSSGQHNRIAMSRHVHDVFPSHPDGRLRFDPGDGDSFIADYSRVPPMLRAS